MKGVQVASESPVLLDLMTNLDENSQIHKFSNIHIQIFYGERPISCGT